MNVASDTTTEVHEYTRILRLEDAPIERVPEKHWAYKGKSFRPEAVILTWSHGDEPLEAKVSGKALKANGEVGSMRVELNYRLSEQSGAWGNYQPPTWLRELVSR